MQPIHQGEMVAMPCKRAATWGLQCPVLWFFPCTATASPGVSALVYHLGMSSPSSAPLPAASYQDLPGAPLTPCNVS